MMKFNEYLVLVCILLSCFDKISGKCYFRSTFCTPNINESVSRDPDDCEILERSRFQLDDDKDDLTLRLFRNPRDDISINKREEENINKPNTKDEQKYYRWPWINNIPFLATDKGVSTNPQLENGKLKKKKIVQNFYNQNIFQIINVSASDKQNESVLSTESVLLNKLLQLTDSLSKLERIRTSSNTENQLDFKNSSTIHIRKRRSACDCVNITEKPHKCVKSNDLKLDTIDTLILPGEKPKKPKCGCLSGNVKLIDLCDLLEIISSFLALDRNNNCKSEKCLLKDVDDLYYTGKSLDPSCNPFQTNPSATSSISRSSSLDGCKDFHPSKKTPTTYFDTLNWLPPWLHSKYKRNYHN